MRAAIIAITAAGAIISGCSGTSVDSGRLNPLNWFESIKESDAETEPAEAAAPAVGDLVPMISSLALEPFGGGGSVILIATGVPPTFGYRNASLVPVNDGKPINGELIFEMRALGPEQELSSETGEGKELNVATTLTERQLEGVSSVRVMGALNEQAIAL